MLCKVLEVIEGVAKGVGVEDLVRGYESKHRTRDYPLLVLPPAVERVEVGHAQRQRGDRTYRRKLVRHVKQEVILVTQVGQAQAETLLMALLAALPEAVAIPVDAHLTDLCLLTPAAAEWLSDDSILRGEQGVSVTFDVELGVWVVEDEEGLPLPLQLYLGIAPEIGAGHEDDYFPLGDQGMGSPDPWNLIPGT